MSFLARMAATAPVPVFAAAGPGMEGAVDDLSASSAVTVEASIRTAAILLVAGTPRAEDGPALRRLHDQMPHPRATLWWRARPDDSFGDRPALVDDIDPVPAIEALHRALLSGERRSEPDILPDEPPNEWRGVGPHGQGGEGMMGGTPYGRPMPMMGDEHRDGLMLDAYTACFGPFLPVLPSGLALELTLQGDVIQHAKVRRSPYGTAAEGRAGAFRLAARLLELLGLAPHAAGLRRLARDGAEREDGGRMLRLIRLSQAIRTIPPGLGVLPEGSAREAAGGDVRARLARWLEGKTSAGAEVEPGVRLADLLSGLEWNEAMLVLNSFDPPLLRALCPVDHEADEDNGSDSHQGHSGLQHGQGAGS